MLYDNLKCQMYDMRSRISQRFKIHTSSIIRSRSPLMLLIILFYTFLTLIETYPLIRDIKNSIPQDLGDPLLNVWTLWWDLESMLHLNIKNYFDANIMYPYDNALAFSEHLTGEAIIGLPFYIFLKNPVAVYNILYIISFIIAGFGTFLLTYRLTSSQMAGLVSGIIYAFAPHRFGQAGHIQTLYSGLFPICFYYLLKLIEEPGIKHGLLLILFILLQSLMNMYYAVYLAIVLPVVGIPYLIYTRKILSIKILFSLSVVALISFLLLTPFLLPYIEIKEAFGIRRDIGTIASLPDIKNLIGINRANWLYSSHLGKLDINEGSFFIGITTSLLALIGIFQRRFKEIYRIILLLLIVVAFFITAGPNPVIHIKDVSFNYGSLYRFLYNYFPAFDGTRVPMRFYIFIVLGFSIFAGASILMINKIKHRTFKIITLTIVISSILIEYHSRLPVIHYDKFTNPPEILKRLRDIKEGPVIFFPSKECYTHIFYASIINKPVYTSFTGYSHFLDNRIKEIELDPGSRDSLKILSAMGIKYIAIFDSSLAKKLRSAASINGIQINNIYSEADGNIFELVYDFKGYFTPHKISDISLTLYPNHIIIQLNAHIKAGEILVPKRLYFDAVVTLLKEGRIVRTEKVKIKVPEIIDKDPVSEIRLRRDRTEFDEIRIKIRGRKGEVERIVEKKLIKTS